MGRAQKSKMEIRGGQLTQVYLETANQTEKKRRHFRFIYVINGAK